MNPLAFILLFAALTLPGWGRDLTTKPPPSHKPISLPFIPNPNQRMTPPDSSATTVSATASAATSDPDADAKGHLAWTVSGAQTTAAFMVDPYRILNGRTNQVGAGWVTFTGRVIGGNAEGILLDGAVNTVPKGPMTDYNVFFVKDYPDPCVMNETIGIASRWFYAWPAGSYRYTNSAGEVSLVRRLDYGVPWTPPPPTAEQIAARQKLIADAKAAVVEKKNAIAARVLQENEDSAERGEPYGLLRMGERYRDGHGVARDLAKSQDYLERAAAAGSQSAADELEQLKARMKPKATWSDPPAQ